MNWQSQLRTIACIVHTLITCTSQYFMYLTAVFYRCMSELHFYSYAYTSHMASLRHHNFLLPLYLLLILLF